MGAPYDFVFLDEQHARLKRYLRIVDLGEPAVIARCGAVGTIVARVRLHV